MFVAKHPAGAAETRLHFVIAHHNVVLATEGLQFLCVFDWKEIRAAALPEAPADKPPLFVDRLVVQKQSADKPDEVHVWLRAVGFVLRE